MRIMRPGSRGPTVELLQLALSRCGIYTETDGIFGRATESSLRSFQRSRNLIADGVAGHETHLLPKRRMMKINGRMLCKSIAFII